jgi:hypothetical protein
MTGALHAFPLAVRAWQSGASPPAERRQMGKVPRYWSVVQSLDPEGARELLGVSRAIVSRAEHLIGEADRAVSEWAESPALGESARSCPACGSPAALAARPLLGMAEIPAPLLVLSVVGAGAILAVVILALLKNK